MRIIKTPAVAVYGLLTLAAAGSAAAQPPEQVGKPPPPSDSKPPLEAVPAVPAEVGGVLTPQGRLILEPSFQYTHTSSSRLTFRGVEIITPVLIGLFTAEDVDQNIFTAALTARLGITNRFELELKLPVAYRSSRRTLTVPVTQNNAGSDRFTLDQKTSGAGLGDIQLALHYQLNQGGGGAYFVGNLRLKTVTGEGPFDVERNAAGVADDLPTGSGFYSVEPSLTILFPAAPAVYFANIGYVFNIEDDVNARIGETEIGKVDPGDTVRLSFGMAYAINPKTSFTLGYKHEYTLETTTEFRTPTGPLAVKSRTLNVGALLLGWSYQIDNDLAINLNLELGVTDDAADTTLTLRMPFGVDVF